MKIFPIALKSVIPTLLILQSVLASAGHEEDKMLFEAVQQNNLEVVQAAFEKGAHPDGPLDPPESQGSSFAYAIATAQPKIVLEFIKRKATLNICFPILITPLSMAVARYDQDTSSEENFQIIQAMLKAGADPNIGPSPLTGSQSKGVFQLLLEAGVSPKFLYHPEVNPWFVAAEKDDHTFLELLLKYNVQDTKQEQPNPLITLLKNNYPLNNFLIWFKVFQYRAKNTSQENLTEALENAVRNITFYIVDRDSPNEQNTFLTKLERSKKIIQFLLQAGADPNGINSLREAILNALDTQIYMWSVSADRANLDPQFIRKYGTFLGKIAGLLLSEGADPKHLSDLHAIRLVSALMGKKDPNGLSPSQAKLFLLNLETRISKLP